MYRQKLAKIFEDALRSAQVEGLLQLGAEEKPLTITIDRSPLPEHGDLSCPLAMQIAPRLAVAASPIDVLDVAEILIKQIQESEAYGADLIDARANAPGYINFDLGPRLGAEILMEVARQGPFYGLAGGTLKSNFGVRAKGKCSLDPSPIVHAYARCSAILRQATAPRINILAGDFLPPLMSDAQWLDFVEDLRIKLEPYQQLDLFLGGARDRAAGICHLQSQLILQLSQFPDEVLAASDYRQYDRLIKYLLEADGLFRDLFAQFNLDEGFFSVHLSVLKSRLGLIFALGQVFGNALGIIDLA